MDGVDYRKDIANCGPLVLGAGPSHGLDDHPVAPFVELPTTLF